MKNLNKKSIILASGIMATIVAVFGLTLITSHSVSAAGTFNISFVETGGRRECSDMPPFSNDGSEYFTYTITVVNNTDQVYKIRQAAFHSDEAGCGAWDGAVGGGWDHESGKEDYAPGESGVLVYRYRIARYNCGRIQYDAGYESYDGTDHGVFIGSVVNYGVDCPITPPTVSCSVDASPSSGTASLNDVDLTTTVSGTATGNIIYEFDCTNNGTWEYTSAAISNNPYTKADLCDYTSAGTYTIKGRVTRQEVSAVCTDTVVVNPAPAISCSISADPSTISEGQSSNLNWTSQNATSCVASNAWSGTKSLSGNYSVSPNHDSTYTLTCYNDLSASATCSAPVYIREDNPEISIDKTVRNVSNGTGFSSSVNADYGDEVEFSLRVYSEGNSTADNVRVWDTLPNYLTYISGSTTVDGSYRSDGIISGGIYIGDMSSGESHTIKFRARIDSSNYDYSTTLTNYGYADADNTNSVYDTATIIVEGRQTGVADLRINKLVRNITTSTGFYDSVNAKIGDELEFSIELNSIGNKEINNVRVWDTLPNYLTYISGSTTVDGSYRSDGIISGGIYIGTMSANSVKTIKFRATVSNSLIGAGNSGIITIDVGNQNVQTSGSISVSKMGRNITQNQSVWSYTVPAYYGDTLELSIQLTNNSGNAVNNVIVKEILPSDLSFISNSITVDGNSWSGDMATGINLGTMANGQIRTVKFRVTVIGNGNYNIAPTTLTNIAYASADGISQINDQASVVISGKSGEVLGVSIVTGANLLTSIIILSLFSLIIAFIIYCELRERKVLNYLNSNKGNTLIKFFIRNYFKVKYMLRVTALRFKKVYW